MDSLVNGVVEEIGGRLVEWLRAQDVVRAITSAAHDRPRNVLNMAEAADYLNTSTHTLRGMLKRGEVAYTICRSEYRFLREDLDAYLAVYRVPAKWERARG